MTEQQNSAILIYFPMMVFSDGSVQSGKCGANAEDWDVLRSLPEKEQNILTSKEIFFKIQSLQEKFGISNMSTGYISLFIRKIFFKELTLEACEAKIGSMLMTTGGGDPNQAKAIVQFIQKEILTIEPKLVVEKEEEIMPKKVTMNLPVLQALSQYERLGDQLITKERIRIKTQGEPVRPSLSYWIKYYRDELGVGHHDSVAIGDFLFRSENGKKLSPIEREYVSLLIKSIEGNFPLSIDVESQEIIFPISSDVTVVATNKPPVQMTNRSPFTFGSQKVTPVNDSVPKAREIHMKPGLAFHQGVDTPSPSSDNTLRFSSSHIFPVEKEMLTQTMETKHEVKREEKKEVKPFVVTKKAVPAGSLSGAVPFVMPDIPIKKPRPRVFEDANPFIIRPSHRDN
ncbi:MAG: hypothetical protein GW815_00110 [Candidatus Moranbacteria bacterium]|nr:hypothetical protein [Candidatus Moranbacteria bacterium]OIQ03115.1 MAG: hypothetical protein AUK58_02320 [Candidatus Moranbacteria bacterium CG2_30_41_165]PIP25473.1 MAG: hypothetical protein COX32_03195 [Candidatus Moranbacteria bacterium CG23_combo_of_CG06-09_8_20_14_all_41_28]PIV86050.1 MAG: hypothetical protein COW50_03665 [Candidatus Moranbacteria bacterium CG17_big_fil_post_rev_8_21_14_2_50_41_107]PIW94158.1 MAG: hypothetical protein COZ86_02590 [Candidatus Moranbacteria bacterium CG_